MSLLGLGFRVTGSLQEMRECNPCIIYSLVSYAPALCFSSCECSPCSIGLGVWTGFGVQDFEFNGLENMVGVQFGEGI